MSDNDYKILHLVHGEYETLTTKKYDRRKPFARKDPRRIESHIPGLILDVMVSPGQKIERGQPLLVLEAMKMQNDVSASTDGTVREIFVKPGETVPKGHLLIQLD